MTTRSPGLFATVGVMSIGVALCGGPKDSNRSALAQPISQTAPEPRKPSASDPAPTKQAMSAVPDMKFLSDSDRAYHYLERIQESIYRDDPTAFRWKGTPEQVAALKKHMDVLFARLAANPLTKGIAEQRKAFEKYYWEQLGKPMPTRFEDPLNYSLLRNFADDVLATLRPRDGDKGPHGPALPHLGTLPIRTVNAETIAIPQSSEHLIVVNPKLFTFCYELSKIALETVEIDYDPATDQAKIDFSAQTAEKRLDKDPDLAKRMAALLLEFSAATGSLRHDDARPSYLNFLIVLSWGMEAFVVGHEYFHTMSKHQAVTREAWTVSGSGGKEVVVSVLARSWEDELEADLMGFVVMSLAWDSRKAAVVKDLPFDLNGLAITGPLLYFSASEIAEDAKSLYRGGKGYEKPTEEEMDEVVNLMEALRKKGGEEDHRVKAVSKAYTGHPPAWLRTAFMRHEPPKDLSPAGVRFFEFGQALPRNLQILWKRARPIFIETAPKFRDALAKRKAAG